MTVIRDQRQMVGFRLHETKEQVVEAWDEWVREHGIPVRRRAGDTSLDLKRSRQHLAAYVSGSKWIADCPNCNGGVACWPDHDRGCCLDCGTIYSVDFPPADVIEKAVELLRVRPEMQRNWKPESEDLSLLERENALYKFDEPDRSVRLSVADLRDVLSAKAFKDLQDKGLLPADRR